MLSHNTCARGGAPPAAATSDAAAPKAPRAALVNTTLSPPSPSSYHRVAIVVIQYPTFDSMIDQADYIIFLLRILERCVAPAEQRFYARCGSNEGDISAALVKIDVEFPSRKPANVSILDLLTTAYPALVRSLKVLTIEYNDYDESAVLGAFAALATHLELSFVWCGLTSIRALEGRCEYLRKVDLNYCGDLTSIDALADRVQLQEVDASSTGITSIEPLRTCPNLTKVYLRGCEHLSSIDALADHQRLQVFDVSYTRITSIEPLWSCPNLTKVGLSGCEQLSSIGALADHQRLEEVDASDTGITSIEPLRSCCVLTKVYLHGCRQLSATDVMSVWPRPSP